MREQEVRELYEAYMQVHQPKEQMNEEFETWVNDLVEEGYDLSDYTWDEMVEIYIDEAKSKLPTRGIDPELYSQFYGNASRSKKVKGKKTSQPGQNRYLAQQNQKRSAKRYEADMGRDRTPSASDYDNHGGGSRNEETNLFDTILEHLIAEGFADTNEAALAIMANMSEEWREYIMETAKDQSDKQIEKGVKTTYKAQNVLDNLHQGRSRGVDRVNYADRDAKVKRMRGRLKTRRDDLFGERNKREDESRAEMKKKYGL
jgi:hypothetical protein